METAQAFLEEIEILQKLVLTCWQHFQTTFQEEPIILCEWVSETKRYASLAKQYNYALDKSDKLQ